MEKTAKADRTRHHVPYRTRTLQLSQLRHTQFIFFEVFPIIIIQFTPYNLSNINYTNWGRKIRKTTNPKFTLEQPTKAQRGSRGIALLFLYPQHLIGVGGQCHAPAALPPGKRAGTHCIGGWVDPTAGLDGYGKSRPPGFDPRTFHPAAIRYTDYVIPAPKK
jgi:hypothetical protein